MVTYRSGDEGSVLTQGSCHTTIHHITIRHTTVHYITIHHTVYVRLQSGCIDVAWGLCRGGSRSTKPGVFPCKVAAAGDDRYLVCVAGAAAIVLMFVGSPLAPLVFCNVWLFMCA